MALLRANSVANNAPEEAQVRAPRPDFNLSFLVSSGDQSGAEGIGNALNDDQTLKNLSLEQLHSLATFFASRRGHRAFHASPYRDYSKSPKESQNPPGSKELTCFPWLLHESMPQSALGTSDVEHGYCQAANDAAVCLTLLANLAARGRENPITEEIRPVVAITSVGSVTKVWIAYVGNVKVDSYEFVSCSLHLDSCELIDQKMHRIWQGDLQNMIDALEFLSIVEKAHLWAVVHLRPWISNCIDEWRWVMNNYCFQERSLYGVPDRECPSQLPFPTNTVESSIQQSSQLVSSTSPQMPPQREASPGLIKQGELKSLPVDTSTSKAELKTDAITSQGPSQSDPEDPGLAANGNPASSELTKVNDPSLTQLTEAQGQNSASMTALTKPIEVVDAQINVPPVTTQVSTHENGASKPITDTSSAVEPSQGLKDSTKLLCSGAPLKLSWKGYKIIRVRLPPVEAYKDPWPDHILTKDHPEHDRYIKFKISALEERIAGLRAITSPKTSSNIPVDQQERKILIPSPKQQQQQPPKYNSAYTSRLLPLLYEPESTPGLANFGLKLLEAAQSHNKPIQAEFKLTNVDLPQRPISNGFSFSSSGLPAPVAEQSVLCLTDSTKIPAVEEELTSNDQSNSAAPSSRTEHSLSTTTAKESVFAGLGSSNPPLETQFLFGSASSGTSAAKSSGEQEHNETHAPAYVKETEQKNESNHGSNGDRHETPSPVSSTEVDKPSQPEGLLAEDRKDIGDTQPALSNESNEGEVGSQEVRGINEKAVNAEAVDTGPSNGEANDTKPSDIEPSALSHNRQSPP